MGIHDLSAFQPARLDAYRQVVAGIAGLAALPQPAPRDAHATLLATLIADRPNVIAYVADAGDLEERAEHIEAVAAAFAIYIAAVMRDTDASAPGGIGSARLDYLLEQLTELKDDAAGLCGRAAEELREGAR